MIARRLVAVLAFAGLAGCADRLPCDFMCTPEMVAAQEPPLTVELSYDDVFGKEWVAGVGVPTEHFARAEARKEEPKN